MKTTLSRTLAGLMTLAGLLGTSLQAQAATASANFTVTVNLTAACQISTPPSSNISLNYTAFQTSAATQESAFGVACTQGLPYTLSLGNAAAYTGSLVGLTYNLSLLSGASGTTEVASATTTTSAQQTAGAGENTFRVKATVAADQAGTCGTSTCSATSAQHTLTVSY
jgi:hypothetical protein